jgi:hypothetical protein
VSSVAAGREGRKDFAEGDEVGVEAGAVFWVEGVKPSSAGEEPVSRVADGPLGEQVKDHVRTY